ncbi:molybdopterin-dependent oxidoreductase [Raoultibacter timonensis]|uniref:molybdopterin-dependent oxidoreductase n=1 Tax=Raoultibacter timonensis TaxID=1907662 RepID=UPI000C84F0FF|nr:molybdopterin-dependent oxidoreductase [Raoultibacter timonensis]
MSVKKRLVITTMCLACTFCLIAGCSPSNEAQQPSSGGSEPGDTKPASEESLTPDQQAIIDGAEGTTNEDINEELYPGKEYLNGLWDRWDQIAEEYAPEIRTLPNGQMVQRTPTEYEVNPDAWQIQAGSNSYNTYWLDADNRGCESCHPDMNSLLKNLPYEHPVAWNDELDNKTTLQQCLFCHSYAPGYIAKQYEFGTLMHGIHFGTRNKTEFATEFQGDCMSCHNATENGEGLELWDLTKYDRLWGINKVADVQGDFKIDQEKTQDQDGVFSYDWMHAYYDNMRHGAGVNGLNLEMPQSLFDEWTITVSGNVENEYTAKLPDLIKEAEEAGAVVEKTSKMVCNWNPVGGGGVTNTEITGIPVSWLIEKAGGYKDDTTGVRALRADGSSKRAFPKDKVDSDEALLVYKIGGEYLDATRGYPCTNWVEGVDAQINSKQIDTYEVTNEDIDYTDKWAGNPNGWQNEANVPMNKPNATILGVPDGLVIQNGQPFTFEGYVDAYDEKIASMEFSMDGGATWTKYDLGDTDRNKMVWWSFTYTPELEGAYCLTVRATTESGAESFETQTVMINAKDKLPAAEETTVLTSGSLIPPKVSAEAANEEDK